MADSSVLPATGVASVEVPWSRVEGFVAQLTHDVRNGFNALELQVTLIGELSGDPEIKEETKRVRQSLAELTRQLQVVRLATGAPTIHLFPYPASDFLEDLRERFQRQSGEAAKRVQWASDAGTAALSIDPEQAMNAVTELLDNALAHATDGASIRAEMKPSGDGVVLSIHQQLDGVPSAPTAEWGRTPLLSSRRNAYGLGAFRARRILEALGGSLEYTHSQKDRSLVTTITFLLADSTPRA